MCLWRKILDKALDNIIFGKEKSALHQSENRKKYELELENESFGSTASEEKEDWEPPTSMEQTSHCWRLVVFEYFSSKLFL